MDMRGPSVEARIGGMKIGWHPAQAGSWSRRPNRSRSRAFPGPCWRGYVSTATINSNTCTRAPGWSDGALGVVLFQELCGGPCRCAFCVATSWHQLPRSPFPFSPRPDRPSTSIPEFKVDREMALDLLMAANYLDM